MDIIKILAEELNIKESQAQAAVRLIDEGNTIPFIARYRKEVTGSLNDEVLRNLDERLRYLRGLEERKEQVIGAIRDQEKLTPELERPSGPLLPWWRWRICTVPINRSGVPAPPLPRRRGWSPWRI